MNERDGAHLWANIIVAVVCLALIGWMAWWFLDELNDHIEERQHTDNSMPVCTDAIADAGGVCKGEPLPPCPTEDSDNCYWDAATMGNGIGRSFVTVDGVTTWDE